MRRGVLPSRRGEGSSTGAEIIWLGVSCGGMAEIIEGRNLSIIKVCPHLYELIMAKSQEQTPLSCEMWSIFHLGMITL